METIISLYEELKKIRVYLIKLGASRRTEKVLVNKLNEINAIYEKYETWLIGFEEKLKRKYYSSDDIILIKNYCSRFLELHENILVLCNSDKPKSSFNMNSFDLKTALNLLPIMTNEESNTKQLIDNIEYYNTLLKEDTCKQNLINFVLKSRLSPEAKLKLKSKYESVNELIIDMRNVLLCKKAATAIQNKLQKIRQNDLSIADYGKEITELFVDLTITQADGNDQCYKILKPINEKMAVKQFADGLRNRRLSTIISARNYSSLKDAVQAAQDEEVSIPSTFGEIMGMYKKPYHNKYFNNGSNYYRSWRGGRCRYPVHRGRARGQQAAHLASRGQGSRGQYTRGSSGGPQQRGKFFNSTRGNQGMRNNRNIHLMYDNDNNNFEKFEESELSLNQFFREE
ncbi:uncharacterized protein LOC128680559 [Plodia interpunctella]|uniref:uncharacterized protein LOC128680559 n=1 Tax=Plodia interpunctella TaxID=58824 RepID=UPI0023683414|nr:uncharacterized protein LOC128680559 [Plodia interpunctella]